MTDGAGGGALVVIVEDDAAIAEGLALNLRLLGYRTETLGDAEGAYERVSGETAERPALLLLDIGLPRQSGLWVLERLRERGDHLPVIVLSARQDEFDKVAALRLGADDYVTKPFALAELLARVAGLLRRSRLTLAAPPPPPAPSVAGDTMRFGDVVVDPATRTVTRAGQPVELTHREFELLRFLCASGGRVLTRDELVRQVWGVRHAGQGRTVDNFVAQLRAKLEVDPDRPRHLLTVRGSGYRFVPDRG